jgi:CRP-like cAMP-binding protein
MFFPSEFDHYTPEQRADILAHAKLTLYKKGEPVWKAGQLVDFLAATQSGLFALEYEESESSATICHICKAPEVLLMGFTSAVAPMTMRALTPGAALVVPLDVVGKHTLQAPAVLATAFRARVERVYAAQYLYALLQNAPPERRLAYAYWQLSEIDAAGRRVVRAKVPQAELAKFIGTSREEVSRKRSLLEQGFLLTAEEDVLVLDDDLPLVFLGNHVVPPFVRAALGM